MELRNQLSVSRGNTLYTLKVVPSPGVSTDAANKAYVDDQVADAADILLDDSTEEHLIDHLAGFVLLNR